MTRKFDVIAIGTGSAASTIASRCREAGWQVAIVDSRPFGGTVHGSPLTGLELRYLWSKIPASFAAVTD
jgi:hypothetical protein